MLKTNIQNQIKVILRKYPGLNYDEKVGVLHGFIAVDNEDEYCVDIDVSPFPERFPIVKETNERITPIADNHMYSDGRCCFTTEAKEILLLRKGLVTTLIQFVDKIVITFFQNNSYREINNTYQNGEYSHGIKGIIEAYSDILGVTDKWLTISVLVYYLAYKPKKGNDICYCGSTKKLVDCHWDNYKDLLLLPRGRIVKDLKLMGKIIV